MSCMYFQIFVSILIFFVFISIFKAFKEIQFLFVLPVMIFFIILCDIYRWDDEF